MIKITPDAWRHSIACAEGIARYAEEHPDGEWITPELLRRWDTDYGFCHLRSLLTDEARETLAIALSFGSRIILDFFPPEDAEDASEKSLRTVARELGDAIRVRVRYHVMAQHLSRLDSYRPEVRPHLIVDAESRCKLTQGGAAFGLRVEYVLDAEEVVPARRVVLGSTRGGSLR